MWQVVDLEWWTRCKVVASKLAAGIVAMDLGLQAKHAIVTGGSRASAKRSRAKAPMW
jgi:hypothetical protein